MSYLNRIFPGKESGGISERIAHALFTQFVVRSDCLIDAHGGGLTTAHLPCTLYRQGDDEALNGRIVKLARATGLEWLCEERVGGGTLFDETTKAGILAIGLEVGGEGRCREEMVETDVRVIHNVLRYLDMVDGEPDRPERQTLLRDRTIVTAGSSGIFRHRPDLTPRSFLKQGEAIGTVSNLYGDVLETVVAPHDGMLNMLRTFPTIRAGDMVTTIWRTVVPVDGDGH